MAKATGRKEENAKWLVAQLPTGLGNARTQDRQRKERGGSKPRRNARDASPATLPRVPDHPMNVHEPVNVQCPLPWAGSQSAPENGGRWRLRTGCNTLLGAFGLRARGLRTGSG